MIANRASASPFLDDLPSPRPSSSPTPHLAPRKIFHAFEAPFPSEDDISVRAERALARELYAELEDPTFAESFEVAAEELRTGALRLLRDPARRRDAHRALTQRLQPLSRRLHAHVDRLGAVIGARELESLREEELDLPEEESELEDAGSPAFEQFFKSLKKKLTKAVKGAVGAVKRGIKKGVKLVGQLALGPMLAQLKRVVKPILDRVLGWALDKLPPQYRGVALELARRLGLRRAVVGAAQAAVAALPGVALGGAQATSGAIAQDPATATEPTAAAGAESAGLVGAAAPAEAMGAPGAEATWSAPQDDASPAAVAAPLPAGADDPGQVPSGEEIEQELDARLTEIAFAAEEDPEAGLTELEALQLSDHHELAEDARAAFAAELVRLGEGEDPTPLVEGFLPAILPLLRMGVKLIGRQRVVSFIAKAIGGLIRPLVGPSVAPGLGQAIADLGLRALVQAELGEAPDRVAIGNEALVATVEETVRSLGELPAAVLESSPLLEAAVLESFEAAAAANMPPEALRPELREASVPGVWVGRPSAPPRTYKKFTHVFEVTLTAQRLAGVRTFGGRRLDQWMADALGGAPAGELRAKVHLFEATARTQLVRLAMSERALAPYRGRLRRVVHPLTVEAAAALLQQPSLGRGAAPPAGPAPRPGLRFYFLELDRPLLTGFAPRMFELIGEGEAAQAKLRLSEAMAQRLATAVRQGKSAGVLVHHLRRGLRGMSVPLWVWTALGQWLPAQAPALVAASDGPEDGISLVIRRAAAAGAARVTLSAGAVA